MKWQYNPDYGIHSFRLGLRYGGIEVSNRNGFWWLEHYDREGVTCALKLKAQNEVDAKREALDWVRHELDKILEAMEDAEFYEDRKKFEQKSLSTETNSIVTIEITETVIRPSFGIYDEDDAE